MPAPRLAFLGCGFITHVHSRHLRSLKADVVTSYASRDKARAEAFCRRYRGTTAYSSYSAAIADRTSMPSSLPSLHVSIST